MPSSACLRLRSANSVSHLTSTNCVYVSRESRTSPLCSNHCGFTLSAFAASLEGTPAVSVPAFSFYNRQGEQRGDPAGVDSIGIDQIIGSSSTTCDHQIHLLIKATTPALLMSRLMGTQRMSPGNPQDGHSLRDTSNSSSSGISVMPELIDDSSSGSGRNSRENLSSDTTSSEEGNDEDTRTKLFSLIMKKYATRQSHEKQRAAHTVPQASLTKCHRLCAHMHAPRRAGGPWIQCTNQCREKENHNGRHNCFDQWHKGNRVFPPHRKGCLEKEKTSLTKCHRFCAHMRSPCIEGGPWTQCRNQCQDKQDHNGRHNCYRGCHNQPFM